MTATALTSAFRPSFLDGLRSRLHLDATTLKIIACVLMVIDHIHQMFAFVGAPTWLTMIGRVVFPIFLFLMADSFHYTRDRKKFLFRLFIASTAMTIGSYVISLMFPNDYVMLINNAFSTFLVAGFYMWFYDIIRDGIRNGSPKQIAKGILLCFVPILTALPVFLLPAIFDNPDIPQSVARIIMLAIMIIPNVMMVEGGFLMVFVGLLFYIFRENRWIQVAILAALSVYLIIAQGGFANIQWMMVFAAIPMLLYNGKPGRGMKDFFYVFYPAHIWILYIVSTLLLIFHVIAPTADWLQLNAW